jgi:NADPH:quinone reductase-like Zn-dependent oxidoreductase
MFFGPCRGGRRNDRGHSQSWCICLASLKHRAKLASGETVFILGATGVAGELAVQIAKILGAGHVVAAGRNERVLSTLLELGADATIRVDRPEQELIETFRREAGEKGFDVIIDYLWGRSDRSTADGHYGRRICGCEIGDSIG